MIKRVWHSIYRLEALHSTRILEERVGALLKIDFSDGLCGYADCHPWESLGDLPLDLQLEMLKCGEKTSLLSRSFYFARLDADARSKGVSLFEGLTIPKSHALVFATSDINSLVEEGFSHFKIKGGAEVSEILSHIPKHCKARIDFNARLSEREFDTFLKENDRHLEYVDFIEDPFPYDDEAWQQMQMKYPVRLACDRLSPRAAGHDKAAAVLIVKPAVQEGCYSSHHQRIVYTSYLDHPFGQAAAAWSAAVAGCREICGLNSHRVYRSTPFSELLAGEGPNFRVPEGTGFGFDSLLNRLKWSA